MLVARSIGPNTIIEPNRNRNSHHNTVLLGLKDALQCQVHHWLSKVIFFPFQNAKIRLNACCVSESICQSTAKHSQMLKASFQIIPSRIKECCMILLINEELGTGFPLVSIEKFLLMSFNEIDLLIGPKLYQLTSIWIKNRIDKIAQCHFNKLKRHHKRSEIECSLVIWITLSLNSQYTLH